MAGIGVRTGGHQAARRAIAGHGLPDRERNHIMAEILPFPLADARAAQRMHEAEAGAPPVDPSAHWGDWMLLAQEGDAEAYRCLLLAITPYLRGIARRYMGQREDAEDVVQDILLLVHDIRHTYEPGRPFKPWLATLASRRCIDALRRRARRQRHEADLDPVPGETLADLRGTPEDLAARQDAIDDVHRAVDGLSPRQREAVRLLRLRELSLDEASARSGQGVGALKVASHRAMKALRRALSGEEPS